MKFKLEPAAYFYVNVDPRRRQELVDSNMIHEDHTKVANLPDRFINEQFDADRFQERLAMFNQNTKK